MGQDANDKAWDAAAVKFIANKIAAAAFEEMRAGMETGIREYPSTLPLLDGQIPFVFGALRTAAMRVAEAFGIAAEPAEVKACDWCGKPLKGIPFIVWTIKGETVPLCRACSQKKQQQLDL